jgi:predicted TIM-barrel fold metal-dependent hydrolase
MAHGVVSADSHVMEPGNLWETRLERGLRSRAPHVIESRAAGPRYLFVAEGAAPFPVAGGFAAGRSGQELARFMNSGYEAARPSGWDPVERIKDQELDGIDAEVLYPTLGMTLFTMSEPGLQRACFRAYNGWLAEFCGSAPRRLYGIGLISLEDVAQAVRDLEEIARQGMRGALVWGAPPEGRPYSDAAYDPFWQAACEVRLPVSLHIIASRGRRSVTVGEAASRDPRSKLNPGVWYMTVIHEIQESLATLVFGGVLERFPALRIVSAENDTGWVPHFLFRMDHAWDKWGPGLPVKLSLRPSDYFRRQVFATFQDDPVGPATYSLFGPENYMWASDFPHSDSTFPESRAWIEKNFASVPDAVRRRIVHDNAVALYGMQLA